MGLQTVIPKKSYFDRDLPLSILLRAPLLYAKESK